MAGLVPAIHVPAYRVTTPRGLADARIMPGHDAMFGERSFSISAAYERHQLAPLARR